MVLAAVGKNGTGKDFFLEYVAKTYGFPMISIGDVVRELATADGLELTRDNLHATSKKYMTANGQTFFPELIVKKIKESDSPNFLVSGIRPPSDIEIFKKAFGDKFVLVDVVVSDDEVRYQRMLARGSERDGKSVEKLRENDLHEEEIFHTSESERWLIISSRTMAALKISMQPLPISMTIILKRSSINIRRRSISAPFFSWIKRRRLDVKARPRSTSIFFVVKASSFLGLYAAEKEKRGR